MRLIKTLLLLIFWLVLISTSVAQDSGDSQSKAKAAAQEKTRIERAIERQQQATARAAERFAAEQSRAAYRAAQLQRRAAARAAAETTRAAKQSYLRQQRAAERSAVAVKRMQLRMNEKQVFDEAIKRQIEGTFKFLWSRPTIDVKNVVKSAPYSAKAVTEHTQTLSDGNQIIHRNETLYYRDSEGRLRTEQTLKTIGKWAAQDEPAKIITIYDPVAGNYYSLDPRTRTALKDPSGTLRMKMREYQKIETQYVEKLKLTNDMKIKLSDPPKDKEKYVDSPKIKPDEELDSRRKKETLGKQTIQGVVAEGTRTTRTIPAGEIGNVRPIEIIDESWYSPELQLHVLTKHQDPRSGETVYRLINIDRGEQNRSLFEVPADYRVVDKFSYRSPKKVEEKKAP